jgi:DNA polymerase III delta prime subunit
MCTSKLLLSGNHGRSNVEISPPGSIGNLVSSVVPQQSTRSFVVPSAVPIKKSPDITDIIGEKAESRKQKVEGDEIDVAHEILHFAQNDKNNNLTVLPSSCLTVFKNFPDHWHAMFEQVFAHVPTIYYPLKETVPVFEDNIIKIVVKNEIQKEHFEAKKREALEYLRTHFDEKIEDVVIEINEKMETKKIIYDIKDKLQNFKEQNEEFDAFLQILDIKIKD